MEDNFNNGNFNEDDAPDAPSGGYSDIESFLEDKFNFPGGSDNVGSVKSASGFDNYLNERFQS